MKIESTKRLNKRYYPLWSSIVSGLHKNTRQDRRRRCHQTHKQTAQDQNQVSRFCAKRIIIHEPCGHRIEEACPWCEIQVWSPGTSPLCPLLTPSINYCQYACPACNDAVSGAFGIENRSIWKPGKIQGTVRCYLYNWEVRQLGLVLFEPPRDGG